MQCMGIAKPRAWVSIEDAGELKPDLKVYIIRLSYSGLKCGLPVLKFIQQLGFPRFVEPHGASDDITAERVLLGRLF